MGADALPTIKEIWDRWTWPHGYGYCHCGCGQKTSLASISNRKRGWIKGLPVPRRPAHGERIIRPEKDRFWEKVAIMGPDDCWEWQTLRDSQGYGHFQRRRKVILSHRMAYLLYHGSIPDGLDILHHCDNPPCCNPAHLFAGTHADNMADMMRKGRHPSLKGEDHPRAKLTERDVRTIRRMRAEGIGPTQIAREYGITRVNVQMIIRRQSWAHVEP